MPDMLTLTALPTVKGGQGDGDDWMNIDRESAMVGKIRYSVEGDRFTIFSIMIFPEYAGRGYGERAIGLLKERYGHLVADRVRFKARGFWEAVGFTDREDGCFEYRKRP